MKHTEETDSPLSGQGPVFERAIDERALYGNLAVAIAAIVPMGALFAWSYWPTLVEMVGKWESHPDQSHGYLVVPLALFFLWARRERFPTRPGKARWLGLILILGSIAVRWFGGYYHLGGIDGWSIIVWSAGVVLLFGGHRVLIWAAPSIIFLLFMVPLPFSIERMFSLPLQKVATEISCWTLQFLGQPAIAQGHTILLGEHSLEVAQACCGLRIFMGIVALAFAYLVIVRGPWWQKVILALSTIPIALVANASRIVVTGMLYQYVSSEAAKHFSHDFAGWVMIPFAALLFWLVLLYLRHTVQEVEEYDVRSLIVGDGMQENVRKITKEVAESKTAEFSNSKS